MADDDRDLIARAQSITKKLDGRPLSTDEILRDFALYGLRKRAIALEALESELRGPVESGPNQLRRRLQLMELREKMSEIHEALRRAGR